MNADIPHNPTYLHHKKEGFGSTLRELVFGMEDGMVSTMGAITGIAVGSGHHGIVLLSGAVIIAVESISMGVGSYLSNKSEHDVEQKMLAEEKEEIDTMMKQEEAELIGMLTQDGWSHGVATQMAAEAAQKPDLMLKEMAYRELKIIPGKDSDAVKNGFIMWGSYILGGAIPLLPYFFVDVPHDAIPVSVGVTLLGLFILGVYTTKFTLSSWWKGGLEMVILAGLAGTVGYVIGHSFNTMLGL